MRESTNGVVVTIEMIAYQNKSLYTYVHAVYIQLRSEFYIHRHEYWAFSDFLELFFVCGRTIVQHASFNIIHL